MTDIKKIGILTSGGDCAGLNAVIFSVVNAASKFGWIVYGIHDGTNGLTEEPLSYEILTPENFSNTPWPRLSGSYLGSLNSGIKKESQAEAAIRFGSGVKKLGLDALVVVGGDGSMNIVSNYCNIAGVKMVGIPKTIDNDTPLTEFSVGFNTASEVYPNIYKYHNDNSAFTPPCFNIGSYGARCRTFGYAFGFSRICRYLFGSGNSL